MNLFQKGLLAFGTVILVTVVIVAIVAGYGTETAFRRYAVLYSGRTQMAAEDLVAYYVAQGGWEGLQDVLPNLIIAGRGRGRGANGAADSAVAYLVADAAGTLVASTTGSPAGRLTATEMAAALPMVVGDTTVGYLVVDVGSGSAVALDEPARAYLARFRWALALGAAGAAIVALILAGLLTRSIVLPIRTLSSTAEIVAQGHFDARTDVHGRDEIGRLAATFNQMAASLEGAEEARRAQTADIAHELRNPLAVLQSSLEALSDRIYEPTPENIEPALDQVRTLNRLVEDLRTLALADAGQLRLDLQPQDIVPVVARSVEGHRDALTEKGIALDFSVNANQASLPAVAYDYARLTQVLNNVLSNAARYVPRGGAVHVTLKAENDGVQVCVADNGPGVPKEDLGRLFDRFWRSEPSRSRSTGGSGLGLAIADRIIGAHAGHIWAEPTPGRGLTICFWLPGA